MYCSLPISLEDGESCESLDLTSSFERRELQTYHYRRRRRPSNLLEEAAAQAVMENPAVCTAALESWFGPRHLLLQAYQRLQKLSVRWELNLTRALELLTSNLSGGNAFFEVTVPIIAVFMLINIVQWEHLSCRHA